MKMIFEIFITRKICKRIRSHYWETLIEAKKEWLSTFQTGNNHKLIWFLTLQLKLHQVNISTNQQGRSIQHLQKLTNSTYDLRNSIYKLMSLCSNQMMRNLTEIKLTFKKSEMHIKISQAQNKQLEEVSIECLPSHEKQRTL